MFVYIYDIIFIDIQNELYSFYTHEWGWTEDVLYVCVKIRRNK